MYTHFVIMQSYKLISVYITVSVHMTENGNVVTICRLVCAAVHALKKIC